MYSPYREESQLNFKIPWDTNTARGFGVSLILALILIFVVSNVKVEPIKAVHYEIKRVPLEMISFGDGDGTGVSKGNLTQEGMAHKGQSPTSGLDDASIAGNTKYSKNATSEDPSESQNIMAKADIASNEKSLNNNGFAKRNVGSPDGLQDGRGLGSKGNGAGAGLGFGDIEWGGGGNRIVTHKALPKYPSGVNTSAQIRIKFTVSSDGIVTSMVPLQKGDPTLEKAAMDALRLWRFNPIKNNNEMYGIITFTFRLS